MRTDGLAGLDAAEGGHRLITALRSGLVEQPGEQRQSPGDQWFGTRACELASSGGWLLPELLDELPELGLGVAGCPPRVFMNGSLPSLAQRDTVLGETDSSSATSAGSR